MTQPPVARQPESDKALSDKTKAAFGMAALAVLIWSGTPAATKFAVLDMDPVVAALMRTVLAAAIVLPLAWARRLPLAIGRDQWLLLILSSVAGFFGFSILFSLGTQQTSASHAALINAGIPLFAGLFGAIAERRLPGGAWFAGMALAFGVVAWLIGARPADGPDEVTVLGDLLCLASSASAGFGYVTGARLAKHIGSQGATFWGIGIAGVVQAPVLAWLMVAGDWQGASAAAWGAVVYPAVGSSILAYIAWYWALAHGGIVRIAPTQFAMAVTSTTVAVIAFNEPVTTTLVLSACAIVAGIVLARRG